MFRDNMDSYKARAETHPQCGRCTRDNYFAIAKMPERIWKARRVVGAQAANELLNIAGVKASFVLTTYNNEFMSVPEQLMKSMYRL